MIQPEQKTRAELSVSVEPDEYYDGMGIGLTVARSLVPDLWCICLRIQAGKKKESHETFVTLWFSVWTSLGLNQGPPDYELLRRTYFVIACGSPSLYIFNFYNLLILNMICSDSLLWNTWSSVLAVVVTETTWRPGCPPKTLPWTDGWSKTVRLKGKEMAAGKGNNCRWTVLFGKNDI